MTPHMTIINPQMTHIWHDFERHPRRWNNWEQCIQHVRNTEKHWGRISCVVNMKRNNKVVYQHGCELPTW